MKLNNEDGEKEKDHSWVLCVFDLLFILVLLVGTRYYYKQFTNSLKEDPTEEILTEATVINVDRYIDDNGSFRYYMEVKAPEYGKYTIDLTKGEFIKYKTKEKIDIKIKNNTAYILKNNE